MTTPTTKVYSGKPDGEYSYRTAAFIWYGGFDYYYDYSGVITVHVSDNPPVVDPLLTQLNYSFEAHVGDINGDSKRDILVVRTTGGINNGVTEKLLLRQTPAGGAFYTMLPSASQISTASSWPSYGLEVELQDFNVDGFVDLELKGVAAAISVPGVPDQMVFSPGQVYAQTPLGRRSVDDPLKQFVANMLDYQVDEDYFPNNSHQTFFTAETYWTSCGYGTTSNDPILVEYSFGCIWFWQSVYGFYNDYSNFSSAAVAIWMTAQNIEGGAIAEAAGVEEIANTAEDVLGVEIGGWEMEEVLGATGDHTQPNVRRALEIFFEILGIGRANAQEISTDEAPSQAPRSGTDVYLVGHGAKFAGVRTGTHVALEHSSDAGIPCASNQIPTCQTISAHPRDGSHVIYVPNAPEDIPLANATLAVVTKTGATSQQLWDQLKNKAESYDNTASYDPFCLPFLGGYNSNSFVFGLIDVVEASPGVSWLWLAGTFCGLTPIPSSYFH